MPGDVIGEAVIRIGSDATEFGKKLDGQMSTHAGRVGKLFGGLLVSSIGVAVAGISTVVVEGLHEAAIAQNLNAQFNAGIKSTGNIAHLSVKGMDELAASIAGMSGQSFQSVGKSERLLQTFTSIKNVGVNKIFDQATLAAANMAAKMGGDSTKYAMQLGKALNDPVKGMTALSRSGVQFTASQKEAITAMVKSGNTMGAQKLILKELNTEFGGAAAAAGGTMTGSLARLQVAFGEISKSVMEGIIPILTPAIQGVASALTKAGPAITILTDKFKEFASPKLGAIFALLVIGVKSLVGAFRSGGDAITSGGFAGAMQAVGLQARRVFDWLANIGVPAFKAFASSVAIPALMTLGAFIAGTLVPALVALGGKLYAVVSFFAQNQSAAVALGAVVGGVLLAMGVAWMVQATVATIAAARTVLAWFATSMGATVAEGVMQKTVAQMVVGWVIMGAQAMWNAIKIAASWVLAMGPIGWVVTAVIALGILIATHMDLIKGWISSAWTWIQGITTSVWGAISSFFTGLWASITSGIASAWSAVTSWVSAVVGAITGFVAQVVSVAATILYWWTYPYRIAIAIVIGIVLLLWRTVAPIVGSMATAVGGFFTSMWAKAVSIFTSIRTFIVGVWNAIVGFVLPIVVMLADRLVLGFTRIWNSAVAVFNAVKAFLLAIWNSIFTVVAGVVSRVWSVVAEGFARVSATVGAVMGNVRAVLTGAWNAIYGVVSSVVSRVWSAVSGAFARISSAISGAAGAAIGAASSLIGRVVSAVQSGIGSMANIGGSIVSGLISGIVGAGGRLWNAISSFIAANVPAPVRKILGIGSPSKVFFQIGDDTVAGLELSLLAGQRRIAKAAAALLTPIGPNAISVPLGAPSNVSPASGMSMGSAGPNVTLYTYNPVAEPTSVTVNKALQRVAALGLV